MDVSADLYRFIGGLSLDGTGVVIENLLDQKVTYVSKHFTSNLKVSTIAVKVKPKIVITGDNVYNNTASTSSLLYMLQHTTLAVTAPDIYRYCQAVMLDLVAILYAYEDDPTLFDDLTEADIDNTISNALFLQDYFSGYEEYADIATQFTECVVELGVLKNYLGSVQGLDKESISAYGTV